YGSGDPEGHRIERAGGPAERAVRLSPREVQLHSRLTVGKPSRALRRPERGQGQLQSEVRRELEGLRDPDLGGAAVDLTRESLEVHARRDEVRLPAEELPGLADGEVDDRRLELEVEVPDPEGGVVEEGRLTHRRLVPEEVHLRDGRGAKR